MQRQQHEIVFSKVCSCLSTRLICQVELAGENLKWHFFKSHLLVFLQQTATASNGENKPLFAFIISITRCFSRGTGELLQNTHLRLEGGFEKIPHNDSLLTTGKLLLRSPPSLFPCTAPYSMTHSLPLLGCALLQTPK